jgi:hypothetical protein
MRFLVTSIGVLAPLLAVTEAHAATRTVGPGKTYAKPCAAIGAADPGDVIEVDAGSYDGDHCSWSKDNLTIRGVGGRAKIDAGKNPANIDGGKGIFVVSAPNATIENFELSGAKTAGDGNGAGIRHQGKDLTVRNCYFHDNEDGILGSPIPDKSGNVLIEASEFANNGAGDGYSHNMYLGHYAKFTLHHSYTHGANVGHLVKSRALENHILYNRITDLAGTTASYEINLPSAGLSYVIGNLIEQAATTQNPTIVDYASESGDLNSDHRLFVVNNTIVNDKGSGTFVQDPMLEPAVIMNNILVGGGEITHQTNAVLTTNFTSDMGDPKLADAGAYDYRLLAGSPCIDKGTDPGSGAGQSLTAAFEYAHELAFVPRTSVGKIDIGAYEFGNPTADADAGAIAPSNDGGVPDDPTNGGAPGHDGANGSADGGTTSPAEATSGCGCRTHGARGSSASVISLGALAVLGARRRRR